MPISLQRVPLRSVLTPARERLLPAAGCTYKEVTVRMWGRGVVLRREVGVGDLASGARNIVRAGQFIFSRIDARNGAFGVVPRELDGAVVSNDFPSYCVNLDVAKPEYLAWLARTPNFIAQCSRDSEGTTNRVRLAQDDLLDVVVPMPELSAQENLVRRLDDIDAKINQAARLSESVAEIPGMLVRAAAAKWFAEAGQKFPFVTLGDLITRARKIVPLVEFVEYEGFGTRMWGGGAYVHERKLGSEFNAERYAVSAGQLVYNEVWAHKGAIAVVREASDTAVVSRHFHVFDVDWSLLEQEYLQWFFGCPLFWQQCAAGSVGTSGRGHMRRRHLEEVRLPRPPVDVQRSLAATLAQLHTQMAGVRDAQMLRAQELEAFAPSVASAWLYGRRLRDVASRQIA